MRPLHVVVFHILGDQVVEVVLPKDKEMVEALVLDALYPTLDESVHVRRLGAHFLDLGAVVSESVVECLGGVAPDKRKRISLAELQRMKRASAKRHRKNTPMTAGCSAATAAAGISS